MSKEKVNDRINNLSSREGKKSRLPIIIIAIIVVCVLIGVILFLVLGKDAEPEKKVNTVVTPENVEEVIAQMKETDRTPIGSYQVNMTSDWEFENGDAVSSNAYVSNATANQTTVYFTIKLKDDNHEIYKSPYLPVGSSLKDIKLDTSLDAGTYDTVLTYHLVDDDKEELSTVSVALPIIIKN